MPNTSRLTISRKTAQIVTIKSIGGAKADVSPIAAKVKIIKIDDCKKENFAKNRIKNKFGICF